MTQTKLAKLLADKLNVSATLGDVGPYAKCLICAKHYFDCDGDPQQEPCVEGIREWLISQNRGASS